MAISPVHLINKQEEINRKYPGLLTALPSATTDQVSPETIGNEPIIASGTRGTNVQSPTISAEDLIPKSLGNLEFAQEAQQANKNTQDGIQHKGLLGVKGTLRDILGYVGDTLLAGSGHSPIYGRVRQQERLGDAMAGYTSDPLAAAERVAQIDPNAGMKLQELAVNNELKKAQLSSIENYRQTQVEARRNEIATKTQTQIARLFVSPVAKTRPDLAMRQAKILANRVNIPLEELGVREDMTPEEMQLYSSGDMTVNQTMQLPYKERMTSVAEQNADANTTRANRAPPGRPAPNPTSASMAAPLIRKLQSGQKLSPSETETLDRLGYNVPKSGSGRGVPPPPPPAGGRQFRVIR